MVFVRASFPPRFSLIVSAVVLMVVTSDDPYGSCELSTFDPKKPKYKLKFCQSIFPEESCCSPAQDAEISEHYFNLLDAGPFCAKQPTSAKDRLKDVFCFGCSPRQSEYTTEADDGSGNKVINICKSLADQVEPSAFDDCGMIKVEERGSVCLGDDTVIPSQEWGSVEEFLNDETGAKPPFFEDGDEASVTVRVVDSELDPDVTCYAGMSWAAPVATLSNIALSVAIVGSFAVLLF